MPRGNPSPASRFGKVRVQDGETVRDYKTDTSKLGPGRPYVPAKVQQGVKNPQNRH
jgi:hypothetical protein